MADMDPRKSPADWYNALQLYTDETGTIPRDKMAKLARDLSAWNRLAALPKGEPTWTDEAKALHWIDRYATGIDDEPQMRRILACVGIAAPPAGDEPDGWKLVPAKPTQAWAYQMANTRQGQRSEPRCEPPTGYDIEWCLDRIREVLSAAPPAGGER